MAELTKADLSDLKDDIREYIKERCDGLDLRLDTLNGRTRTVETKVAVLEERTGSGSKQGAVAGGAVAGLLGILEIARHFFSKP